jgi:hypothetical protein
MPDEPSLLSREEFLEKIIDSKEGVISGLAWADQIHLRILSDDRSEMQERFISPKLSSMTYDESRVFRYAIWNLLCQ